ncbi:glycosyltransferase family 39 protein [Caminibacter sp.]
MRLLLFFIGYYLFLLYYGVNFLSFSIVEQESIQKFWPLKYILDFSFKLFGKNDFALRLPEIFFSIMSIIVFYLIAKKHLKKDYEFATFIFSLIPGFIVSSLIVNKSIYLVFLTLLFIYIFGNFISYVFLLLFAFLDYSFIVLYLGLIFYSIYKKNTKLLLFSLLLLTINANYFNYKIAGKPQGYFLDIIGTYVLIFSPFVFFYFIYSLYKGFFYKKNIIFFVSITAFLSSILFSFRQRIKIDDFAPFVLPYIVNMVKIFLNSYRVRLPQFRKAYKFLFVFLLSTMIIFDIMLFINKYTPARNLSESFYFIKPVSKILKKKKINYIFCNNRYLCRSLNFYGIKSGNQYKIIYSKTYHTVSIFHKKRLILKLDVSKLYTL